MVSLRQKGSHRQYKHPSKPGLITIAGHPADDLAPGTLNSVLKQARLKETSVMAKFTVIIEKAGGNYSAYCPELPGCVAMGKTETETFERIKEALSFHLEGLKETHAPIPETTCSIRQVEIR